MGGLLGPLKPLDAILPGCTKGFRKALNWSPTMPRDARTSDGYTNTYMICEVFFFSQAGRFVWSENVFEFFFFNVFESDMLVHTEKYFPNLVESNRNQIVFTMHRMI